VRLDAYLAATLRAREYAIDEEQWNVEVAVAKSILNVERVRRWWTVVGRKNSSSQFAEDERFDWTRFDVAGMESCKKGGWQEYGFRNQGQCMRFANTQKDSR
jgi:hypothetical protein